METKICGSKQDILNEMLYLMHPIIGYFSKFSSAKDSPGDKISDELNTLKGEVALLKSQTVFAHDLVGLACQHILIMGVRSRRKNLMDYHQSQYYHIYI